MLPCDTNKTGKVTFIYYQPDCTLLYLDDEKFYCAIANVKKSKHVKIGDMIEYTPCGVNFGWFVE